MTAEEAVRHLEESLVVQPDEVKPQTEDALEAIKNALTLAHRALEGIEWAMTEDGREYCLFCGRTPRKGHASFCPREAALAAIKKGAQE